MNTERIEVATEFSDAQIAETFLHHRVLIVPVVDAERRVLGVITRSDFFRAAAEGFLASG
jgi:CBS domain-containing protein